MSSTMLAQWNAASDELIATHLRTVDFRSQPNAPGGGLPGPGGVRLTAGTAYPLNVLG